MLNKRFSVRLLYRAAVPLYTALLAPSVPGGLPAAAACGLAMSLLFGVIAGSYLHRLAFCNGDYVVNIRDVTAIQRHLADFPATELFNEAAADLDGNGVSVNDATLLQKYLADFETNIPIGSIVVISVN